ncbi:MAG: bifunctional methylenetetrahydrofolate dehydrogenase/methenyltetrahydrofolate cyclohydrolase FolD [Bacteroidetes bacterium]|nr:bifunctional methylenetetrahydrofolate dehydrogenase/methenyltetrahydrofolate cyclohydrolase FolD [Bacteroidota bacterium]
MPIIIDGKATAAKIVEEIKKDVITISENIHRKTILALLLVGEDPASQIYVRSKSKRCEETGIESIVLKKDASTSEEEVLDIIQSWNSDDTIDGILVQLPLPKHINESKVLYNISPKKDVDGFHPENVGRLVAGLPTFIPCTPMGIYELLKRYEINLNGKHCVVLGRSNIVGKPIANLLYQKNPNANAIVTICHTGAKDLSYYTKQADVLIAAMGVPELIKANDIKDGAVIIDVGINRIPDPNTAKGYRVVGDVDYNDVINKVSAITPVPGGVGPMTISMLLLNTLRSAKKEIYK